jgi:putative endonuclease
MPHFAYLLRCADGTLYAGYTNDLAARVHAHNHSKAGARYTKSRRPVALAWSQKFRTKSAAMSREAKIKTMTREEKLAMVAAPKKSKMK